MATALLPPHSGVTQRSCTRPSSRTARLSFAASACLAALLLAPLTTPASATDLRSVLTDYTLESWSQKDGLADGSLFALAQDREGYLWVAGDAGVFRFDGARFTPWNVLTGGAAPTRSSRVLLAATDGAVWVGYGAPGGVASYSRGAARLYGTDEGLPSAQVTSLLEGPDARIWAATTAGLFRLDGDRWEHWDAAHGVPAGAVSSGYVSSDRRLFVGVARTLLQLDPVTQQFRVVAPLTEDPRAIGEDPLGAILVVDQEDGFRRAEPGAARLEHLERGRGRSLLRDRRNNVWVGTAGQGLWRVKFDQAGHDLFTERATALTGLLADGVQAMVEDREGNIWAATTEGLNRLTPHKVAQVTNIGLVAGVERAGDGALWVGTVDELLRMPIDASGPGTERHPLDGARLRALHADRDGVLWVASNHGLARLRGNRLEPLPLVHGGPMPRLVDSITGDGHGGIWLFDNERGLLHWQRDRLTRVDLPAPLSAARVEATLTDSTGRAWFTFSNGDVATSVDGTFRVYGKADGLDAGVYQSIYEDADHVVWLGGMNGLTRFDGRFVTTRSDRGFPVANVTAIVDAGDGMLWVGSGAGILQIERREWEQLLVNPAHQATFRLFDRSDGLAGLPYVYSRNRRAIRSDDGRLWFVTGRGLTVIDPANLGDAEAPHPVHIEGLVVNGTRVAVDGTDGVTLPAGSTRLEVEYTALNLTSPLRQHFRYRLEGFDSEWVDAGARRQAFYTNLPPRSYRFHVMTSDAEGAWTEPERASVGFSIRPMFYQTTWFLALCVVGVAGVVGLSWRLHVARVRRQFALLIGERARLSRELHDTLLQSLVGIALQFDAMANDPQFDSSHSQRREFTRMRRRVEEYIREARQSISDLRSPRIDTHDLATALREAGEREVDGRPIEFTFRQEGPARSYPAGLEDQLLKIGREAIVNAARHAHADRISIELESTDQALTLRVTDNGTGFDPSSGSADGAPHYGLTSMRERAEDLGGRFSIESIEGRGTRVETTVPIPQDTSRAKRHAEPTLH